MGKAVVVPLYKAEGSNSNHLHPSKLILRRTPEKRWGTLNTERSWAKAEAWFI